MTSTRIPVGACGDTAPTGDHPHQHLFDARAHLELVCRAYESGHQLQIDRAITAARRHLEHNKDQP